MKFYEKIIRMLSDEEFKGNITNFQKREIINNMNSVTDALARKYFSDWENNSNIQEAN